LAKASYSHEYDAKWFNFIDYLYSSERLEQSRIKSSGLIRQRVLILPVMRVAVMPGFKASVQTELNAFFAPILPIKPIWPAMRLSKSFRSAQAIPS
jgi:hypothetical protein